MDYIIPINNIRTIKINHNNVSITYNDNTRRTMIIGVDAIVFEKEYMNTNNAPIIDHCV